MQSTEEILQRRLKQKLSRQYNKLVREKAIARWSRNDQKKKLMSLEAPVPEVITNAAVFEAQALYMRFVPLVRISQETGVSQTKLKQFIYGDNGWKAQREQIAKDINEQVKMASLHQLRKAAGISLHLITLALEDVAKKCAEAKEAPDLREAECIAGIFSKLHKAKVVEEMDEDEKKKIGLSPAEVLRALGTDPYLKKAIAVHSEPIEMDDTKLQEEVIVDGNENSESVTDTF